MSKNIKKLKRLYEQYKNIQDNHEVNKKIVDILHKVTPEKGYADGGTVDSDPDSNVSQQNAFQSIHDSLFGKAKPTPSPTPTNLDDKYNKIRQQNVTNASGETSPSDQTIYNKGGKVKGYSRGGFIPGYADGTDEPIQPDANNVTMDLGDVAINVPQQVDQGPYGDEELEAQKVVDASPESQLAEEESDDENVDDSDAQDAVPETDTQSSDQTRTPAQDDQESSDDSDEESDNEPEDNQDQNDQKQIPLNQQLANAQAQRQAEMTSNRNLQLGNLIGSGIAGRSGAKTSPLPASYFESLNKTSELPVKNITEQIAIQQNDPNSAMSKIVRDYYKNKGLDIPDNASAADIKNFIPSYGKDQALQNAIQKVLLQQGGAAARNAATNKTKQDIANQNEDLKKQQLTIEKEKADAMAKNASNSLDTKTNKALQDYAKLTDPTTASSRSVLGTAGQTINGVEGAFALLRGTKNLNDITPQQNEELIRVLDRVLSKASPTEFGQKSLNANTLEEKLANIKQFWNNMPEGAQKAAFVNQIKASLAREAMTAEGQAMSNLQRKKMAFAPYVAKAPDLFQNYDNTFKDTLFTPQLQQEIAPYRAAFGNNVPKTVSQQEAVAYKNKYGQDALTKLLSSGYTIGQ